MGELLMQILFSLVEVNLIFSSLVGMGAASSQPALLPAPGAISRALIMSFIKSQPRQQLHLGMWLLARPFPPCLLLWVLWELIFFFFLWVFSSSLLFFFVGSILQKGLVLNSVHPQVLAASDTQGGFFGFAVSRRGSVSS